MVVTLRPFTSAMVTWQLRTGAPSSSTVQEPHEPIPQPNLVPVSPSPSRSAQSRGVSGERSTGRGVHSPIV